MSESTIDSQPKPPTKRPGPASKLTRGKAEAILARIQEGSFLKDAIIQEGLSLSGFYRGISNYPEIRESLKSALQTQKEFVKEEALSTIRAAFSKDWKAAAWYLERNYPGEYGRIRYEHSGPDGSAILFQRPLTELTDHDIDRLLAERHCQIETDIAPAQIGTIAETVPV